MCCSLVLLALAGGCASGYRETVAPEPIATTSPPPVPVTPITMDAPPPARIDTGCAPAGEEKQEPDFERVWGVLNFRGYALGEQVAPNGNEFRPLFSIDLDFNIWICPDAGLYIFSDSSFWGQRAAPGITNPSQGVFDFSKRELDFTVGGAWNYWGPLEARVFAYSANNLNRGDSTTHPSGYNDGVGLESRWYLGTEYAELGQRGFDVTRATFVSAGYYPTKDMIDGAGRLFKPGAFIRAYLTLDLLGDWCYLYEDTTLITLKNFPLKLLRSDFGAAVRPFGWCPFLEFRIGCEGIYDLAEHDLEWGLYGALRYTF
jgi:hypothetical protein